MRLHIVARLVIAALVATSLLFAAASYADTTKPPQKALLTVALWSEMATWRKVLYPERQPESTTERVLRLGMASQVVVEQATDGDSGLHPIDQIALIATIWRYESAMDWAVHHGDIESPAGHQDNGRARCLGQIHHTSTWISREQWIALTGLSPECTANCAHWTGDMLWIQAQHCLPRDRKWDKPLNKHEAARVIAGYGQGLSCDPKPRHYGRAEAAIRLRDELARFVWRAQ